jgi:hypothetical protein
MYLTTQEALAMNEPSLRAFVGKRIGEGLYLDYKEALSGSSDKDRKREFLKDVTAFANAAGGDLLIGVKEPAEGVSTDEQILGVDDGQEVAQSLENLAYTSIDPRIPGLRMTLVSLSAAKSCILVHVPPSMSRPHMVSHMGHRSFYVRHSESSVPMTTHEIREAVLSTASSEERARQFVRRRLAEARDSIGNRPAIFIQAAPLITPETTWDVYSDSFANVLRGDKRWSEYGTFAHYALCSRGSGLRATIDGLVGTDGQQPPEWETEVHRTGYVSAFYTAIESVKFQDGKHHPVLHSGYVVLFKSFCQMLSDFLEVANGDVPYLIACSLLNAGGIYYRATGRYSGGMRGPYPKQEITWPEHLRSTGDKPSTIADALSLEMCNAFGYRTFQD